MTAKPDPGIEIVVAVGYVAGSLQKALEFHLEWLNKLPNRLSERGITAERRRLIIEKQTDLLRDALADSYKWVPRR